MPTTERPDGPRRRDAGFTLVEVLVGIGLFTVVIGLLTTLVIETLQTTTGTRGRLANVDQVRVAMDAVTKELRTAVRPEQLNTACTTAPCEATFTSASSSAVTFYANHGTAGMAQLMTYRVEQDPSRPGTGRLIEQRRTAVVPSATPNTACASGCVVRVLATGLAWPVTTSVFTFADEGCTTFGAASDLSDISCVAVTVPVLGGRDYAGTSASSTVFLPNSVMGR